MPLKSQAQRAWMHIHHPKMADEWEKHTPKGKKLPQHVEEAVIPDEQIANDAGLTYVQQRAKERFGSMPKLYRYGDGTIMVDVNGQIYKVVSGGLGTVQFKQAHLQRAANEDLNPKDETEVAQFVNQLMKWARTNGVKPAEARELKDAFWSLYQVLPEIMPNVTPEEFGQEYLKSWREGGMQEDVEEQPENTGDIPENPDLPQPREEGEEYQKTAPTWALRMDDPFEVETIEGPMSGKAGDYLAQGPEGDMWVVDGDVFGQTYEPVAGEEEQEVELDDGPTMESVFRLREDLQDLSATHPPPGSQPMKDDDLNKLGQAGQSAKQGLDALQKAGQDVDAFKTPTGQFMAYPKAGGPASTPLQADMTKGGLWSPVTGTQTSGSFHPMTSPS